MEWSWSMFGLIAGVSAVCTGAGVALCWWRSTRTLRATQIELLETTTELKAAVVSARDAAHRAAIAQEQVKVFQARYDGLLDVANELLVQMEIVQWERGVDFRGRCQVCREFATLGHASYCKVKRSIAAYKTYTGVTDV